MAIDFPSSPTVGQTFTHGLQSWTWDGIAWNITTSYDAPGYLPLSGGAMNGPLTLDSTLTGTTAAFSGQVSLALPPTAAAHAVRKDYADSLAAARPTLTAADARYLRRDLTTGSSQQINGRTVVSSTQGTILELRGNSNAVMLSVTSQGAMTLAGQLTLSAGDPINDSHATRKDYVDAQVTTRLTQVQADSRYVNVTGGTLSGSLQFPLERGILFPDEGAITQRAGGNVSISGSNSATSMIYYGGSGGPDTAPASTTILSRRMADNRYYTLDSASTGTAELVVRRPRHGLTALSGYTFGLRVGGTSDTNILDLTQLIRGFNSAGDPVFNVATGGNVTNANNSYGSLSDARLKHDITDATPQLGDVLALRVVHYKLINDPDQNKQIGLVAQEVQAVKPGLVEQMDEGGMFGVKYSILVPILVKGVQELAAQIAEMSDRLATLEASA